MGKPSISYTGTEEKYDRHNFQHNTFLHFATLSAVGPGSDELLDAPRRFLETRLTPTNATDTHATELKKTNCPLKYGTTLWLRLTRTEELL